jgi:hypothetical protein
MIAEIRKLSGKPLKAIAVELGFSHGTVACWSQSVPHIASDRAIIAICDLLKMYRLKEYNRLKKELCK